MADLFYLPLPQCRKAEKDKDKDQFNSGRNLVARDNQKVLRATIIFLVKLSHLKTQQIKVNLVTINSLLTVTRFPGFWISVSFYTSTFLQLFDTKKKLEEKNTKFHVWKYNLTGKSVQFQKKTVIRRTTTASVMPGHTSLRIFAP